MPREKILLEIRNCQLDDLNIDHFQLRARQCWCLYGHSSAAKDSFLNLLRSPPPKLSARHFFMDSNHSILSFASQQAFYEQELRNDESDWLDRQDPGTLVSELLPNWRENSALLKAFGLNHCLDLGYRQLSSGQGRKLLLLQNILARPSFLVLENPYDGLDKTSKEELNRSLQAFVAKGLGLMILVSLLEDIPPWARLACFYENRLEIKQQDKPTSLPISYVPGGETIINTGLFPDELNHSHQELVVLEDGFARYGERLLFSGLQLTIHEGDHTLITGKNGSGKSTLLEILFGDNANCYANKLSLFGKKRGSGESIWDIKAQIGLVSTALHRDHRSVGTSLMVVLSGLYDSIGLYQKPHPPEIQKAVRLLAWLGLEDSKNRPYKELSYSSQRLVLIARALIKTPRLLILDEPTLGLDERHRRLLLDFLETAVRKRLTTILYVSHRQDEYRSFFTRHICLNDYGASC